jgi:hypothetical protein
MMKKYIKLETESLVYDHFLQIYCNMIHIPNNVFLVYVECVTFDTIWFLLSSFSTFKEALESMPITLCLYTHLGNK